MFCLIIESISSFFWRTRIARHLQHTTDHCPLFLLSWNSQIFQISENYLPCAKNTKNASNARIEADIHNLQPSDFICIPLTQCCFCLSAAYYLFETVIREISSLHNIYDLLCVDFCYLPTALPQLSSSSAHLSSSKLFQVFRSSCLSML